LETSAQESASAVPARRNGAAWVMLLAIVGLAAVLRLGGLGAESFWWDEVLTTYSAREPLTQVIQSVRNHENAPPFYFIVLNLWAKCFGMSDLSLRLPSALMGIATVALLCGVGTALFDGEDAGGKGADAEGISTDPGGIPKDTRGFRTNTGGIRGFAAREARRLIPGAGGSPRSTRRSRVGLTCAALLALSPIHIAYSQEARMYALLVLLLTLNLWAAVRVMRTGSTRGQAAYVITAALALLTHTFAAFTLLAVNLFWLVRFVRRGQTGVTWRRWILLNAAVIVLFGPWVPATLEVARMGLPWLSKSTTFRDAMVGYAGGVVPAIALAGLAGIAIVRAWRWRDDRVMLLALLALVPLIGPIAYGTFTTRYGIAALIGLTMLVACGAAEMGRWACVTVVLLAAVTWGMTSTLGHARFLNFTPKADVRGAMALVKQRASERDVVVAGTRGIWHVMERYAPGSGVRIFMDANAFAGERAERVWVIAPNGITGPDLPMTGYEVKGRTALEGVDVLELRRDAEPATTQSVPSTYPRN
jgi:hypothetical protein